MSGHDDLERWLAQRDDALWAERDGPHLPPERLALLAEGSQAQDAEKAHLVACNECRTVLRAVIAEYPTAAPAAQPTRSRWHLSWVLGGLAVAGLAVFLISRPPADPSAGYQARGNAQPEAAAFVLRATTPDGLTTELSDGDHVPLNARLGFVYGNAKGTAKTLTVLGWDGTTVHWYYPEKPGQPAPPIQAGPESRGTRLPFDVQLSPDHRAGPLTVVAAFDTDPQQLAAELRADRTPGTHFTLTLRETR